MLPVYRSSIDFKSNIYPIVAEEIAYDEAFLHALRDADAIKVFEKRASRVFPTALQKEISRRGIGVTKCMNSPEGDFPWGTILEDGKEKIVCKCEQRSCPYFSECRPDAAILSDPVIHDPVLQEVSFAELQKIENSLHAENGETQEEAPGRGLAVVLSALESFSENEEEGFADGGSADSDSGFESPVEKWPEEEERVQNEGEEPSEPAPEPDDSFEPSDDEAFVSYVFDEEPESSSSSDSLRDAFCGLDEGVLADAPFDTGRGYDSQQAKVVEADPSSRIYVNAGAGAGKTHTLIEKLKYMIEEQDVCPEDITVLSFTRSAVDVVQGRLKAAAARGEIDAPWQDIDVTTLDKLASRILYSLVSEENSLREQEKIAGLDYDGRILAATKKNRIESGYSGRVRSYYRG